MMLQLAEALPNRISRLVVIDGLPSPDPHPDVSDHERHRITATNLEQWLDYRRASASNLRKPGTLEDLARRRKRMNPRLSDEWLRYLVSIGARRDPDGWRWKLDASIRMGGFGPWRPEWSLHRLRDLRPPLLGLTATIEEEMGWGTKADAIRPYLPPGGRIIPFDDTGHFIHIEQPRRVADLVARVHGMTIFLAHDKTKLAFHTVRDGEGPALLLLHALGESSPRTVGPDLQAWPGPVYALDFTGHGESTVPGGGGYTAEILMGDADCALAVLGSATLVGRGLGAYIALLLAGARARSVRGAVLCDGPGIAGGGDRPGPVSVRGVPHRDTTPTRSRSSNSPPTSAPLTTPLRSLASPQMVRASSPRSPSRPRHAPIGSRPCSNSHPWRRRRWLRRFSPPLRRPSPCRRWTGSNPRPSAKTRYGTTISPSLPGEKPVRLALRQNVERIQIRRPVAEVVPPLLRRRVVAVHRVHAALRRRPRQRRIVARPRHQVRTRPHAMFRTTGSAAGSPYSANSPATSSGSGRCLIVPMV